MSTFTLRNRRTLHVKARSDLARALGILGGGEYEVSWGLQKLGAQTPYVFTAHEVRTNRGNVRACGTSGEEALRLFPDEADTIRAMQDVHLCFLGGGPLHYLANATWWLRQVWGWANRGDYTPEPSAAFKAHVLWGALEGDEGAPAPLTWDADAQVRAWATAEGYALDDDDVIKVGRAVVVERVEAWLTARLPAIIAHVDRTLVAAGIDPTWHRPEGAPAPAAILAPAG